MLLGAGAPPQLGPPPPPDVPSPPEPLPPPQFEAPYMDIPGGVDTKPRAHSGVPSAEPGARNTVKSQAVDSRLNHRGHLICRG